ncbi:MAG TPA: ABC transporter substrate-binding protein, partial [Burkholderiales bacterium]|nr:ABC transporter substrate-binding protein [Burkholderiales bacterium]
MKNLQVGITVIAAAVAAALVSVGCGQQSGGGAEVRIGHVAPLTGGIAHLGKDNENGARLAIDEANEAKITIDGKQVKFTLVAEDDQADPKVGTTVAQKL